MAEVCLHHLLPHPSPPLASLPLSPVEGGVSKASSILPELNPFAKMSLSPMPHTVKLLATNYTAKGHLGRNGQVTNEGGRRENMGFSRALKLCRLRR